MTQPPSHFFLDVDDDVRLRQIFGQAGVLSAKFLDFFFHRLRLDFGPRFCGGQSLEDSLGALSPPVSQQRRVQDLRGGEGRQGQLTSSQRLRLLVRCVVCTPLCRSPASVWQLLRDPAAKPPDRRPVWRPLHSAAARQEASSAPFRGSQTVRGNTTPRAVKVLSGL